MVVCVSVGAAVSWVASVSGTVVGVVADVRAVFGAPDKSPWFLERWFLTRKVEHTATTSKAVSMRNPAKDFEEEDVEEY